MLFNVTLNEDDFLCFTTPFIERRTSLQWIVELEGNIRGNDYLMTFEELGSGFALIPPIPYQPVLLMRDNAGEILKVPVNDFEAYVRWGSPPERCLTTLVVDAWGNPAIRRQCSLLISP